MMSLRFLLTLTGAICVSGLMPGLAGAQTVTSTTVSTHDDTVPRFCASPTITSVRNGLWSDAATWSGNRLPQANDKVSIAANTTVTYDVASSPVLDCVEISGILTFSPSINTRLTVGTMMVMPEGSLIVGNATSPIVARSEIIMADRPLQTGTVAAPGIDSRQYGNGLIGFGTITMHGRQKSPTFVRLAVEPQAGATSLRLVEPVNGWVAGDQLVLPDTRRIDPEKQDTPYAIDEVTLQSVSADGKVLTLTSPLQYTHPGARNGDGVLEFLPHVNNVTRNVMVESQNLVGTRGHTLFTHRATVDIRYTAFRGLGRTKLDTINDTTFNASGQVNHIGTNQRARYPVHFHHLLGPTTTPANGYQYTFLGNAVDGVDPAQSHVKWGVAIHNSHYGLVQDNVVYKAKGAGFAFEDGSESFNLINHNSVVRVYGLGGRADKDADPTVAGLEGSGFWSRGPNNYMRDNVVSNVRTDSIMNHAYIYSFVYLGHQDIPQFKGADMHTSGQFRTVNMNATPLLQFQGNEAYGYMQSAMTIWWLGTVSATPNLGTPESVVKDFRIWNASSNGIYLYENNNLTIDGLVVRGQGGLGIFQSDYFAHNLIIRNANIQGMEIGWGATTLSGGSTLTIENSYLRNQTDIAIPNLWISGGSSEGLLPRKIIIRNVKFDTRWLTWSTSDPIAIRMDYGSNPVRNLMQTDEIYAYDYNQVAGDNFRLYYIEQAPTYVVPQTIYNPDGSVRLNGAPVAGLTNQQTWDQYGIAIGGAVSPCQDKTSHPKVFYGFTCPTSAIFPSPSPQPSPSPLPSASPSSSPTPTSSPSPLPSPSASPRSTVQPSPSPSPSASLIPSSTPLLPLTITIERPNNNEVVIVGDNVPVQLTFGLPNLDEIACLDLLLNGTLLTPAADQDAYVQVGGIIYSVCGPEGN